MAYYQSKKRRYVPMGFRGFRGFGEDMPASITGGSIYGAGGGLPPVGLPTDVALPAPPPAPTTTPGGDSGGGFLSTIKDLFGGRPPAPPGYPYPYAPVSSGPGLTTILLIGGGALALVYVATKK